MKNYRKSILIGILVSLICIVLFSFSYVKINNYIINKKEEEKWKYFDDRNMKYKAESAFEEYVLTLLDRCTMDLQSLSHYVGGTSEKDLARPTLSDEGEKFIGYYYIYNGVVALIYNGKVVRTTSSVYLKPTYGKLTLKAGFECYKYTSQEGDTFIVLPNIEEDVFTCPI